MIISETYRYVYLGIPRTGSKSMNHWLIEYFDGKWHGGHHDTHVPEEAAGYLVFTIVRNPYERAASGHFAVCWDDLTPSEVEIGPCQSERERLRRSRAIMEVREKRQNPSPTQSTIPLVERCREAAFRNEGGDQQINQSRFVERGQVSLVLYFERLPECLVELPFVDPTNVPPFPHHPERGVRPAGNFLDFFHGTDQEEVEWAYAADDFRAFGYRRFDCGLPDGAPRALRLR